MAKLLTVGLLSVTMKFFFPKICTDDTVIFITENLKSCKSDTVAIYDFTYEREFYLQNAIHNILYEKLLQFRETNRELRNVIVDNFNFYKYLKSKKLFAVEFTSK